MDFQILLSPAEDFDGDIILAFCPSFLFPSVRPLRKVDQRRIVKSLTSNHWPSGKAFSCLQRSEESTGYGTQEDYLWNGIKNVNNGVKPHMDKNKQVADNRQ